MELTQINQKLDKIIEYQEKQIQYAKIRFWLNFVFILIFIILPLALLPFFVNRVFEVYGKII